MSKNGAAFACGENFIVDCTYRVNAPNIVSEVIDGEAIVMDLRSGAYFSADGVGAAIWQAAADGATRAQILAWAKASFATEVNAEAEAEAFLADIIEHKLMTAENPGPGAAIAAFAGAYAPPTLAVHEDMQDLITLDPIHDVGEVGWPTRKAD